MKFGRVDKPEAIDFTIPPDHPGTAKALKARASKAKTFKAYVGCAKWNKKDLKNFCPQGVKDEPAYYSSQFNCIELNRHFTACFPSRRSTNGERLFRNIFVSFPSLSKLSRT